MPKYELSQENIEQILNMCDISLKAYGMKANALVNNVMAAIEKPVETEKKGK